MRLRTRVDNLERRQRAAATRGGAAGGSRAWRERFASASPANREALEVAEGTGRRLLGFQTLHSPDPLPERIVLDLAAVVRAAPVEAEWREAEDVVNRFLATAHAYQRRTGDLFPQPGFGLRAESDEPCQLTRARFAGSWR